MNDETDFSNHPVGIGEIRADRNRDAKDWSPRDALINALRDLDRGDWKPDKIIIAGVTERDDGRNKYRHFLAGGSSLELIGLLEVTKMDVFGSE